MLAQIFTFLLDLACGLLAGACLLRLYMQHQRIGFGNPVGQLVFALTDWVVLPLRRLLPTTGRWDWASLLAAYGFELLQYLLLWLVFGLGRSAAAVPLMAAFGLLRIAFSSLIGLVIVYAVLSWVQPGSPLMALFERLVAPFVRPIRRAVPLVGGIDFSPLLLLVVLHVAMIVLGHVQARVLAALVLP